jgi:hypothetical protein
MSTSFRTYKLKPGGLPPTLAGWEAAIAPALEYTAHLVINMYALDGPPRITHIWGSSESDSRAPAESLLHRMGGQINGRSRQEYRGRCKAGPQRGGEADRHASS